MDLKLIVLTIIPLIFASLFVYAFVRALSEEYNLGLYRKVRRFQSRIYRWFLQRKLIEMEIEN